MGRQTGTNPFPVSIRDVYRPHGRGSVSCDEFGATLEDNRQADVGLVTCFFLSSDLNSCFQSDAVKGQTSQ